MTRSCGCAGGCGPDDIGRRDFIGIVGVGGAAAAAGGLGMEARAAEPVSPEEIERWKRALLEPARARVYRSAVHTDVRMHLGGIGTGNLEIGADGRFTTWQLFNTLRDGHVDFLLAARAGGKTKLLQTTGGPDLPRVKEIVTVAEYPLAVLRFEDPELPVRLELVAFSPFSPLDTRFSSMPLAVLSFRVENPGSEEREVSLAALLQNPVGYEAAGDVHGLEHPAFGGNVNEPFRQGGATGILLRAEPGQAPSIDRPATIVLGSNLRAALGRPAERPEGLEVKLLDRPEAVTGLADPARTVILLEEAGADFPESLLSAARTAVEAGAVLVLAGRSALLDLLATTTGGKPLDAASTRPNVPFQDFEKGYGAWTVEGEAFGKEPARGTLPNQQHVSGFQGEGLVNTYLGGDDATGRLVSPPFAIERRFIRFLVGGGAHRSTQVQLLVDGEPVRVASGKNAERLEPAVWDVSTLQGRTARIAIVDEAKGGWGHINADGFEFSDLPGSRAALEVLDGLLPARLAPGAPPSPRDGAVERKLDGGASALERGLGKGKVLLVSASILPAAAAGIDGARQHAYETLCGLADVRYQAPRGPRPSAPGFGELALAAVPPSGASATVLPGFGEWSEAWSALEGQGGFGDPASAQPTSPTGPGRTVRGAVAVSVKVPAGKSVDVPFLLSWRYPNKYGPGGASIGCHYATMWQGARDVIGEAAEGMEDVLGRTARFRNALHRSTLPYWLLDCLTLPGGDRSGTSGWSSGSPTATPTAGRARTAAASRPARTSGDTSRRSSRLFPDLEREMRRIDFKHQQRPDGGVNNRTDVPSPPHPTGEQPFADGHASCILKAYREALNSPDEACFKRVLAAHQAGGRVPDRPRCRRRQGASPTGILQDDQWNTYDEALHGVTTLHQRLLPRRAAGRRGVGPAGRGR